MMGTAPANGEPTVDESAYPGCYDLDYRDGHTAVRKSDGVIVAFRMWDRSDNDISWNDAAKLNQSQLLALAQAYRTAAGVTGQVGIDSSTEYHVDDVGTGDTLFFDLRVSPRANGVGYHASNATYLEISHTTGRLLHLEFNDVPTPPATVVPSITEASARAAMVSFIFSSRGIGSFADLDPPELCIWKPVSEIPAGPDNFLTSTHAAMAAANQGMLIYNFYIEGRDTFISKGVYSPRFQAFVDAQTGSLLLLYEYKPMGGGGKPGMRKPNPALGPGPLEIVDLATKQSWNALAADLSPAKGSLRTQAKKVLLKRGKFQMIAHLDLATGLVRANGALAQLDKASLAKLRAKWLKQRRYGRSQH